MRINPVLPPPRPRVQAARPSVVDVILNARSAAELRLYGWEKGQQLPDGRIRWKGTEEHKGQYRTQKTEPGTGRKKKEPTAAPAEGEPDPAKDAATATGQQKKPALKRVKVDHNAVGDRIEKMLEGDFSDADVGELKETLLTLTVPQLNELKARFGLKGGKVKADIAGRVSGHVEGRKKPAGQPPARKPPIAIEPSDVDGIFGEENPAPRRKTVGDVIDDRDARVQAHAERVAREQAAQKKPARKPQPAPAPTPAAEDDGMSMDLLEDDGGTGLSDASEPSPARPEPARRPVPQKTRPEPATLDEAHARRQAEPAPSADQKRKAIGAIFQHAGGEPVVDIAELREKMPPDLRGRAFDEAVIDLLDSREAVASQDMDATRAKPGHLQDGGSVLSTLSINRQSQPAPSSPVPGSPAQQPPQAATPPTSQTPQPNPRDQRSRSGLGQAPKVQPKPKPAPAPAAQPSAPVPGSPVHQQPQIATPPSPPPQRQQQRKQPASSGYTRSGSSQSGTGPTDKQMNYAMSLLAKKGYGTRYMNSSFKALGASMRERSGSVADWLKGMSRAEVSQLIDRLSK